jgi:hypothetical protein
MQRLIHNVLPPAALGAVLAMVSISVVNTVSPQQAFELSGQPAMGALPVLQQL